MNTEARSTETDREGTAARLFNLNEKRLLDILEYIVISLRY